MLEENPKQIVMCFHFTTTFALDYHSSSTATSVAARSVFSCCHARIVTKSSPAVRPAEGTPGASGTGRSARGRWVSPVWFLCGCSGPCVCTDLMRLPCNRPVKGVLWRNINKKVEFIDSNSCVFCKPTSFRRDSTVSLLSVSGEKNLWGEYRSKKTRWVTIDINRWHCRAKGHKRSQKLGRVEFSVQTP